MRIGKLTEQSTGRRAVQKRLSTAASLEGRNEHHAFLSRTTTFDQLQMLLKAWSEQPDHVERVTAMYHNRYIDQYRREQR